MAGKLGRQAVVIGAGIAGMAAARVLAGYFEKVVILENDVLPGEAIPRAGTPQARHAHVLLAGGQQALQRLFPDFDKSLAGAGAVPVRVTSEFRFERPGLGVTPQRDLGLKTYSMTRPLVEFTVRKRLGENAAVEIREGCRVLEILAERDGSAARGVRWERNGGGREEIGADLVVDTSGHGNPTLEFLRATGRPLPEETTIGVDTGYSTAIVKIPENAPVDWKSLIIFPAAGQSSRGGFVFPIEGGRWIISLGGRYEEKPPGDWEGCLEFARQMWSPTAWEALRGTKPLLEIERYGFKGSRRRHFERIGNFPKGLLPLGDTLCRFNPVYGQGMSAAAQGVIALQSLLEEGAGEREYLAPAFFAAVRKILDTPWTLAALPDFLHPRTEGQRPANMQELLGFTQGLLKLTIEDAAVQKLFVEVQHLLKPWSVFDDPALRERVREALASMPRKDA